MPFDMKAFTETIRALFPERARQATDLRPVPLPAFRAGSRNFNA
jgi:hypothetical protein